MTAEPMIRVGRIPFLNLLPIFRVLETRLPMEHVRFVSGHPSELNRKLRGEKLDVSPSSSIEYGKFPERYLLCPDISISSRSKVMSVLLFSHRPVIDLPGDPIAVTNSSDTSVLLLEILLREFLGKKNRLVRTSLSASEALLRYPAYLAIGDEAIRGGLSGAAAHVTDLGEWWNRETGAPFVFALWIVSRNALRERGEHLRRFARTLISAKRIAREEMDREDDHIVGPEWIPRDFLSEYWRNLSYDLSAEIEGLERFFRLAVKIGRIPAAPPLRFLDLD
ncbi:MAG: menaquinone biosynthesis protein [Candidatus Deferrimicrobiaceae bacterium]